MGGWKFREEAGTDIWVRFKQDGGWERGGDGPDLRAMWSVTRTLELVQLDGKGRGTGGGLQGLWLIGDSRGEMVRTWAVGCGTGRWMSVGFGAEVWAGEAHGRSRLKTENPVKGEVETTVIYEPRPETAWEDIVAGGGGRAQALPPETLHLGGWRLRGASIHLHTT